MLGDLTRDIARLSPEHFEHFVFHLLQAKYPTAGIRKVDGSGGDQGVDTFAGKLSSGPAIWQAKAFAGRLGSSQKKNVRESLETALVHKPQKWTLCVPFDLRTTEHLWFERNIAARFADQVTCDLMQGSDFAAALIAFPEMRDVFFPNTILSNAISLRQSALSVTGLSPSHKRGLAVAHMLESLAEYQKLDPRLVPSATISTQLDAHTTSKTPAIFGIKDGNVAISFAPRNQADYDLDPITMHLEFKSDVAERMQSVYDYGYSTSLPLGSLISLNSSSALVRHLFDGADLSAMQIEIGPRLTSKKLILLNIEAISGEQRKVLSALPFRVSRAGTKEIELTSDESVLKVKVVFPLDGRIESQITFSLSFAGALVAVITKTLDFVDAMKASDSLSIRWADTDFMLLADGEIPSTTALQVSPAGRQLIADLELIARAFGAAIRLPEEISRADRKNIRTLRQIATGEPFEAEFLTANVVKQKEFEANQKLFLTGETFAVKVTHFSGLEDVELFGVAITTGPVTLIGEKVRLLDLQAAQQSYDSASDGELVRFRAECLLPLRFERTA